MPRTGRPPKPAIERFEVQMRPVESGCIEWTGRIDRYGYGQFLPAGGRKANNMGAHRWSFRQYVGPIPEGYQIDHLCRNRRCVNPDHLEAVTPRQNVMRSPIAPAAVNAAKTHCSKGHAFSPENTYAYGGRRICKACKAAYDSARHRKNRQRTSEGI